MVEATERRALGRREGALGVDLHHPAVAPFRLRRVEVVVGRLLARQVGAPRRPAAGAVVERSDHRRADGAGGRTADVEDGVARVAPVEGRVLLDGPLAVHEADFDDRHADRRQGDLLLLGGGRGGVVAAAEEDLRVGRLVVDGQQSTDVRVDAGERVEMHAVVVAAGDFLVAGGVEEGPLVRGSARDDRVTGGEKDLGAVALGDEHLVAGGGRDALEGHVVVHRRGGRSGYGGDGVVRAATAGGQQGAAAERRGKGAPKLPRSTERRCIWAWLRTSSIIWPGTEGSALRARDWARYSSVK